MLRDKIKKKPHRRDSVKSSPRNERNSGWGIWRVPPRNGIRDAEWAGILFIRPEFSKSKHLGEIVLVLRTIQVQQPSICFAALLISGRWHKIPKITRWPVSQSINGC